VDNFAPAGIVAARRIMLPLVPTPLFEGPS
jgi:hypothetical protein